MQGWSQVQSRNVSPMQSNPSLARSDLASCYGFLLLPILPLSYCDPLILTYLQRGRMRSFIYEWRLRSCRDLRSSRHLLGLPRLCSEYVCLGGGGTGQGWGGAYQEGQRFWTKKAFIAGKPTRTGDERQHRTSCLSFSDTELSGIVLV